MFGRDDWDLVKSRWSAVWENEIIDRCCVVVTAPKNGIKPAPEPYPENYEDKVRYWTDGEQVLKRYLKEMDNTYLAGDAFNIHRLNLGPSGHAGYFKGAGFEFRDTTVWFHPQMNGWEDGFPEFEPDGFLYLKTKEIAKYLCAESKQDFVISMPSTSGNMDVLAHMRGSENVLIDLVEEPEKVHDAMAKIQEVYETTHKDVYNIVKDNNDGGSSVGWLRTWAPGFHAQMQCDISVMISPDMFKEYAMSELDAQCSFLQVPLYHFDGIEQIRHLDMLLAIKNLKMIQWTQVAGQPRATDHIAQLRKIQSSGKGLLIIVEPHQIEPLMEQLSSKGLVLVTQASSREEADDIVRKVIKLTHE